MAKAKETFEEPKNEDAATSDDAVGELEGGFEEYVDPSVELQEGEEEENKQGVALGLHPFGVQIQVTSRTGETAVATITLDEAHRLAGGIQDLTAVHAMMNVQAQMQQAAQIQEMMARGGQPEQRTKSGIIVRG